MENEEGEHRMRNLAVSHLRSKEVMSDGLGYGSPDPWRDVRSVGSVGGEDVTTNQQEDRLWQASRLSGWLSA
jgi:hypothetical protein